MSSPDELTLVIGGQSWPGAWEAVEKWATPFVQRIGFVPEHALAPLYRNAQLFVYPSLEEGFGLPVLEALACGARVVTTADSVMEDIAGPHAVAVDVRSVDELANGLSRAMGADATRDERVARARTFNWEKTAEIHRDAYRFAGNNHR